MVKDLKLYNLLNIEPSASTNDIKKAYAKLSKQWHPDKNLNNVEKATRKFQEITHAKDILMNPSSRAVYDECGAENLNNNISTHQNTEASSSFTYNFTSNFSSNININNIHTPKETPENIIAALNVTLEQIYNGHNISISYNYKSYCTKCDGNCTMDGKPAICTNCSGKGIIYNTIQLPHIFHQVMTTCNICNGTGKPNTIIDKCDICNGNGYLTKEKTMDVSINPGIRANDKIQLTCKGHQYKSLTTDLILIVNEISHSLYTRIDNDLMINIDLSLYNALFGYSKTLPFLNNKNIIITHHGKTDYNDTKYIEDYGMPIMNTAQKGKLILKFTFTLPVIHEEHINIQFKNILQKYESIINTIPLNVSSHDIHISY